MIVGRSYLIAALLSAAFTGGCGSDDKSNSASGPTCHERESRDYAALESLATKTLGSEPHELSRAGACEETGSPRATVQATMSQWEKRSAGVRFLKAHGFNYRGGLLLDGDRKFAAESSELKTPDAPSSVVILTFTRYRGK
jgi:hypothetical protein